MKWIYIRGYSNLERIFTPNCHLFLFCSSSSSKLRYSVILCTYSIQDLNRIWLFLRNACPNPLFFYIQYYSELYFDPAIFSICPHSQRSSFLILQRFQEDSSFWLWPFFILFLYLASISYGPMATPTVDGESSPHFGIS